MLFLFACVGSFFLVAYMYMLMDNADTVTLCARWYMIKVE